MLANEPTQFRASDLPLLCSYVRAVLQEQTASAYLEREGHVVDGRPSPWLAVLAQATKADDILAPAPAVAARTLADEPEATDVGLVLRSRTMGGPLQ